MRVWVPTLRRAGTASGMWWEAKPEHQPPGDIVALYSWGGAKLMGLERMGHTWRPSPCPPNRKPFSSLMVDLLSVAVKVIQCRCFPPPLPHWWDSSLQKPPRSCLPLELPLNCTSPPRTHSLPLSNRLAHSPFLVPFLPNRWCL